jgi:hypothetical protein
MHLENRQTAPRYLGLESGQCGYSGAEHGVRLRCNLPGCPGLRDNTPCFGDTSRALASIFQRCLLSGQHNRDEVRRLMKRLLISAIAIGTLAIAHPLPQQSGSGQSGQTGQSGQSGQSGSGQSGQTGSGQTGSGQSGQTGSGQTGSDKSGSNSKQKKNNKKKSKSSDTTGSSQSDPTRQP